MVEWAPKEGLPSKHDLACLPRTLFSGPFHLILCLNYIKFVSQGLLGPDIFLLCQDMTFNSMNDLLYYDNALDKR